MTSKSQKQLIFKNICSRILIKSSLWRQNQLCAVFVCSYTLPPERALLLSITAWFEPWRENPIGWWKEDGGRKVFLTFHKKINKDGKRKKMLRPQCDVFLISDKTLTNAWSQMKTSFRLRSLNFALKPRPPSKCQYTPPRFSTHLYVYKYIYNIRFFPPVWLRSSDARRFPALVKP